MDALAEWLSAGSLWESAAVLSALAYLVLAARESNWCWYFAFASTAIYSVLFREVSLLMESALNVYYMATDPKFDGRQVEDLYVQILKAVKAKVKIPVCMKLSRIIIGRSP